MCRRTHLARTRNPTGYPAPDGPFYCIYRVYMPGEAVLNGTWKKPPMQASVGEVRSDPGRELARLTGIEATAVVLIVRRSQDFVFSHKLVAFSEALFFRKTNP